MNYDYASNGYLDIFEACRRHIHVSLPKCLRSVRKPALMRLHLHTLTACTSKSQCNNAGLE